MKRHLSDIIGHASEQLVCFDLAKRGFRVVNNPFECSPFDIIAEYKGDLFKVQVKGTYKPKNKTGGAGQTTQTYRFTYDAEKMLKCDIVAFVAMDIEAVLYKTPSKIKTTSKGLWVPIKRMEKGCDSELMELIN